MPNETQANRSPLRTLLAALLGLGLLWLLFRATPDVDIGGVLARTDFRFVGGALLCYVTSYLCRAIRFRLLIYSVRPPLIDLLAVVSVHNLLTMLLPARTGELSYVYLANKRYTVSLGEGAATLLLARLFDVIGIVLFFLAALALRRTSVQGDVSELFLGAGLLLCLAVLILLGLVPGARLGSRALAWTFRRLGLARRPLAARLEAKSSALVQHLELIRSRGTGLLVLLVNQVQWLATLLTCYLLLCAAGVDFSFAASILGSTGLSVALVLPINTFANVGSFEAGWTVGYRLAGLDGDLALATAVVAHLFMLLFGALLGGLGALLLRARPPGPPSRFC